MINIIKKLEQAVIESAPLLEKVELKERHTKYLGDRGKTNLNMNISFEHEKLNWIYGMGFDFGFLEMHVATNAMQNLFFPKSSDFLSAAFSSRWKIN